MNKEWYRTWCTVCTTPESPTVSAKNMQGSGLPFKCPVVHRAQWSLYYSAKGKLRPNIIHSVQYKYTSVPVHVWYVVPAVLYVAFVFHVWESSQLWNTSRKRFNVLIFLCMNFASCTVYYPGQQMHNIQGDSGGICTTLGNDSMSDSKQKSSYEHASDFERLRSYDRLKHGIEGNNYWQ